MTSNKREIMTRAMEISIKKTYLYINLSLEIFTKQIIYNENYNEYFSLGHQVCTRVGQNYINK